MESRSDQKAFVRCCQKWFDRANSARTLFEKTSFCFSPDEPVPPIRNSIYLQMVCISVFVHSEWLSSFQNCCPVGLISPTLFSSPHLRPLTPQFLFSFHTSNVFLDSLYEMVCNNAALIFGVPSRSSDLYVCQTTRGHSEWSAHRRTEIILAAGLGYMHGRCLEVEASS